MLSHGLLGTVASLVDVSSRLASTWPWLSDEERSALLDAVAGHAMWIGDVLESFVRGLPPDVLAALEHQGQRGALVPDVAAQVGGADRVVLE